MTYFPLAVIALGFPLEMLKQHVLDSPLFDLEYQGKK
jgi:hypothetical protein